MAGLKGNNVLLSSSIQYVINVIMTVPALIWLDKWGRRPTLLAGAALMMIWLFIDGGESSGFHSSPHNFLIADTRRRNGNLRPRCNRRRLEWYRRRILGRIWKPLESDHRLFLSLRRLLRPNLGSRLLGLPTGTLSSSRPRESRRAHDVCQLGIQLRAWLFRSARISKYSSKALSISICPIC